MIGAAAFVTGTLAFYKEYEMNNSTRTRQLAKELAGEAPEVDTFKRDFKNATNRYFEMLKDVSNNDVGLPGSHGMGRVYKELLILRKELEGEA